MTKKQSFIMDYQQLIKEIQKDSARQLEQLRAMDRDTSDMQQYPDIVVLSSHISNAFHTASNIEHRMRLAELQKED